MPVQAASLEILEKANVPAPQARAIVQAIEIEIAGAKETLATKQDILILRHEMAEMRAELRHDLKTEIATLRGDLRSQMLHHWLTGCAFQFARTVSGAAPTAGSELIKKRCPSGETAY